MASRLSVKGLNTPLYASYVSKLASLCRPAHTINSTNGHSIYRRIQQQGRPYAVLRTNRVTKSSNWGEVDLKSINIAEHLRQHPSTEYFRHTPSQYQDCLEKFASVSTRGDHRWVYLLNDHDHPSAELLHETGCIISEMVWNPRSSNIALAMYTAASEMSYQPSTVTLCRQLVHMGIFGTKAMFRSAENRFRVILNTGNDPNAFALQALILYTQGKFSETAKMCERALSIGGDDFEWQGLCEFYMGRAFEKLGKLDDAQDYYRKSTKRIAVANEALAHICTDPDEKDVLYYQAACHQPKMFAHFAEKELAQSANSTNPSDKENAYKWATEWSNLANSSQKY